MPETAITMFEQILRMIGIAASTATTYIATRLIQKLDARQKNGEANTVEVSMTPEHLERPLADGEADMDNIKQLICRIDIVVDNTKKVS